ncbi:MAG: hypothetical protein EPO21_18725 [Chloroflexota bacterium]|nr:MAG: hypothetical protein EPO21_18725 [Chloroflexota bacterium]
MDRAVSVQGPIVLQQAIDLRDKVRANIKANSFIEDDIQMERYNYLASVSVHLFPNDPVIGKRLIEMPDANLQWGQAGPAVVSRRLDERLSILIDRLQLILGELVGVKRPTQSASDVLRAESGEDLQQILAKLDDIRREQFNLPRLDAYPFDFIANPLLRLMLANDYIEAQRAFAVGAFKASAILSGGIIEGMLLDVFQRPEVALLTDYESAVQGFRTIGPKTNKQIDWSAISLTALIEAAEKMKILSQRTGRLGREARDFRDTVHPNAELREGRAGKPEAQLLWAIVNMAYREIGAFCDSL